MGWSCRKQDSTREAGSSDCPQWSPGGPAAFLEKAQASSHKDGVGKASPHLLGDRSSNSLVGPTSQGCCEEWRTLCVQSG